MRAIGLTLLLLLGMADGACIEDPGSEEDAEAPIRLEDEELLRARLTEREDVGQPPQPWSTRVAGRSLTITGEYEVALADIRRQIVADDVVQPDRLLFAHELEVEAFYSFGPALSLFAQVRLGAAEDQLEDTVDAISEGYAERGEMWLYSEDVAGSDFDLDLGRLHFEDERRWWWDDGLAVAQELARERSSLDDIHPEDQDVLRIFGQLAWSWSPQHAIELFLLHPASPGCGGRLAMLPAMRATIASSARSIAAQGERSTPVPALRSESAPTLCHRYLASSRRDATRTPLNSLSIVPRCNEAFTESAPAGRQREDAGHLAEWLLIRGSGARTALNG